MIFETIISPIKDEKFNSHPKNSEIWKKAYKREEITDRIRSMHPAWYEYTIQFQDTIPIQCTKMKEF